VEELPIYAASAIVKASTRNRLTGTRRYCIFVLWYYVVPSRVWLLEPTGGAYGAQRVTRCHSIVLASAAEANGVDRLYVIDCGWAHAADQSRWWPGINVDVPIDLSDNCYLIHHDREGYCSGTPGSATASRDLPDGLVVRRSNRPGTERRP